MMQGSDAEAEASFQKALEVARRQSAKSWELRATVSLARLRQKQGRPEEGRQALEEIYDWFTDHRPFCPCPPVANTATILSPNQPIGHE